MCRNIKALFNFEPPATREEIQSASLQFVRKVSGTTQPSKQNEAAFDRAVEDIKSSVQVLLDSFVTSASPKDRAIEAEKAATRARSRFGTT